MADSVQRYIASKFVDKDWRIVSKRLKTCSWAVLRALLILGISYIIIHPLLSKISTSFMSESDLWDPTVRIFPRRLALRNYQLVIGLMNYYRALVNSLSLTFAVSLLQVATCTLVGYGFARLQYP